MAKTLTDAEIMAQIPATRARARAERRAPGFPMQASYDAVAGIVRVRLRSGDELTIAPGDWKELRDATPEQLAQVELMFDALHWEDLDVDISVPGVLGQRHGVLGARASGRAGGKVRTDR